MANVISHQTTDKPLIGISCCNSDIGIHNFHMVAEKYITAATDVSQVTPVLIPALGKETLSLLTHLDGLYLTGSYSNLHPIHYNEEPLIDSEKHDVRDKKRDVTNLALINEAYKLGLPVLGVCRGFQEMNVALGGSLQQRLAKTSLDNIVNHSENKSLTISEQYAPAHSIALKANGILDSIMNGELHQTVNSLHGQGIKTLSPLLKEEAIAKDGLIEAFSLKTSQNFFLGVQWHPEWQVKDNPFYSAIYKAFGLACYQYKNNKVSSK